jgi:hypothetical protein
VSSRPRAHVDGREHRDERRSFRIEPRQAGFACDCQDTD